MHLARFLVAIDRGIRPCISVLSVADAHTFVGVYAELSSCFRVKAPPDAIFHAVVCSNDGFSHIVKLVSRSNSSVGFHLGKKSGISVK